MNIATKAKKNNVNIYRNKKMSWAKHVSKFANDNNITLGEAMKNKK